MKSKSLFILLLVAVVISIVIYQSTSETSAEENTSLKMYVLDGGYMVVNDLSYFTQDESYDGQNKIIDNPVFIIEHAQGKLIWDVGLPDRLADREPEEIDTTQWILFNVRDKLIDQLEAMDLTPDSIDFLAVSHSHSDHIGNANYFKNATWIVDERELELAMGENANTENYDSLKTAEKKVFKGSYDVFGDKSVIVHSMPGHTPGHMCLQVELKDETLLLSGDLYHFNEQRENRRVPKFNTDVEMTLESMEKFENLAKQINARVIIQHESSDYKKLPVFPDYLE